MSEPQGTVLALDYPGRRVESGVRDLRLESAGWRVDYRLAAPFPTSLRASEYARDLWSAGNDDRSPVAVVAYCSGGPLAQEMVAARVGAHIPLLLLDGEPSTLHGFRRDVLVAGRQVGHQLDTSPADRMSSRDLRDHPERCRSELWTWLRSGAMSSLTAEGADADEAAATAEDITRYFLDYLTFLIAAHNTDWPEFDGPFRHIASQGHPYARSWPGHPGAEVQRVPAERNELLGHSAARAAALDFLDRVADQNLLTEGLRT